MKLYDDILKLDIQDYYEARDNLIKFLCKNYNIRSIYQFGDIKNPSISDLDLLIIINGGHTDIYSIKNSIKNFISRDRKMKYIFFHQPIVINFELISFINLYHTLKNLKLVYGEYIEFNTKSFNYEKTLIWNYFFYPLFWDLKKHERLGYRYCCIIIKNMYHSIINNNQFTEKKVDEKTIRLIVENVRKRAQSGQLTNNYFLEQVNKMLRYIKMQEKSKIGMPKFSIGKKAINILGFYNTYSRICIIKNKFYINLLPIQYKFLYDKINNKSSPYIQEIDNFLRKYNISYSKLSKIYSLISILDIKGYS